MARQPLAGHTSPDTAYMIEDYPYGRLRCKRKVWLEHNAKHGYRFVAQTENPKNGRWNAPHKSTYIDVAACMYVDTDTGHVEWTGIGVYTSAGEALKFAQDFGRLCEGALAFYLWAARKGKLAKAFADGTAFVTINNERRDMSDHEKEEHAKEAGVWAHVASLVKPEKD